MLEQRKLPSQLIIALMIRDLLHVFMQYWSNEY